MEGKVEESRAGENAAQREEGKVTRQRRERKKKEAKN